MNFIRALQHAIIGYGIRRANWPKDVALYYDANQEALCYSKTTITRSGQDMAPYLVWRPSDAELVVCWRESDWVVLV